MGTAAFFPFSPATSSRLYCHFPYVSLSALIFFPVPPSREPDVPSSPPPRALTTRTSLFTHWHHAAASLQPRNNPPGIKQTGKGHHRGLLHSYSHMTPFRGCTHTGWCTGGGILGDPLQPHVTRAVHVVMWIRMERPTHRLRLADGWSRDGMTAFI